MSDSAKAGNAKKWLDSIANAEKAFEKYNSSADKVEKHYADLEKLSRTTGDEFQVFWANMEILRPSVYQRPPQPVVMPRHTDTGEVPRKAAQLLERALEYDVEADDLHETLIHVRDDVCLVGRGVAWVLDNGQAIHVERHDFLHEPARKWEEVTWVARRVYLTRDEWPEGFKAKFSEVQSSKPGKDREDSYGGIAEKAAVWEIWDKTTRKVYWITEGHDGILDEQDAFIDVKGFFPCPKPAYATIEPHTLKPVPDFHYYVNQVDEIRALTRRIGALSESLRLKGFYSAGSSDVSEAIEASMKQTDDKAILVPISSAAAMGGVALKDSIIWMPVAEVVKVIQSCVELRKQLIEDVYEITGLSDIMRGVTQAQETLGAQNLKAQFGSVRVREKQSEMVRVAVDVLRIKAEIFAEQFDIQELMSMAGMRLPTAMQLQQMAAQSQQTGQPMEQQVALEQVAQLLQDQRIRPFALEVESDSTIAPNEEAEKASRIEFLTAVGGFLSQAGPMVEQQPQTAPLLAEMLKFGVGAFRAGRDLGAVIDQFAEQVKRSAGQGQQQPDPEAQAKAAEAQIKAQEMQMNREFKQTELQMRQQEMAFKQQQAAADNEVRRYDAQTSAALKQFELSLRAHELGIKQDDQQLKRQQAEIQALLDVEELKIEREQKRPVGIGDG